MKNKIQTILQQIIKLELFGQGLTGRAKLRLKEEIENLKLDVQMMSERSAFVAVVKVAC